MAETTIRSERLNANCDNRNYNVAARGKTGPTSHARGIYLDKHKAAASVNVLVNKTGKILEEQICSATKIVDACERAKPKIDATQRRCYHKNAGWSSLVARWAHNPKVGGSNPPPATKQLLATQRLGSFLLLSRFCTWAN